LTARHHERSLPALIDAFVHTMQRGAVVVVAIALVVTGLAFGYAAGNLSVNNDTIDMLDPSLPFRVEYERLREAFPELEDTMMVVVEAPTPEQAAATGEIVRDRLEAMPDTVRSVFWPAGDPFFREHGLLFRDVDALTKMSDRMSEAQPLLARLAESTTVPTFLKLLTEAETRRAEVDFDTTRLQNSLATAIERTLDGEPYRLSWQRLLAPSGTSEPEIFRETLIVQPVLDAARVNAARPAVEALRAMREDMGLSDGPVRIRFTGSAALKVEELASVLSGAKRTGLSALVLVTAIMAVGLGSIRLIVVALAALVVGLALTAAFAAAAIGRVNLISVAFVVLYVGLGVNYAVHYLLRCRERVVAGDTTRLAVRNAGTALAGALGLSTITTALGFFAFTPTAFDGIAELGLIAGFAMFVTLFVTYTVIPALLTLLSLPRTDRRFVPRFSGHGRDPVRRLLELPLSQARAVMVVAAIAGIAALALVPRVHFDSDPLNLRDPDSESVRTIRTLIAADDTGYRNIQILVGPDEPLAPLIAALEALPTVERTASVLDFVPPEQSARLALVDDMNFLLGPEVLDASFAPEVAEPDAIAAAAAALSLELTAADPAARRLDAALDRLTEALAVSGDDAVLAARLTDAVLGLLPVTMARLAEALTVDGTVTADDVPTSVSRLSVNAEGTRLVQVFPAVDVSDFERQNDFARDVRSVAPGATGAPVIQLEAGTAITSAFVSALTWACLGITVILLVMLRHVGDTIRVLVPLALGGVLTLAFMAIVGLDFNFANVVALPLLLGVGVDNGIHLVYRHRLGKSANDLPNGNVLKTATAHAIVLGALVTAGGFGNLAFSPHAGTASMGAILAVGLALIVLATLVVLPALLGRAGTPSATTSAPGFADEGRAPGAAGPNDA